MKTKKTKRYVINSEHEANVFFDGSYVQIWIEQKRKWLCFDYFTRVSWVILFELGNEDRRGCDLNGVFAGRIMTLGINHRNIATFNLKSEIDTLYAEYLKSRSQALKQAKQIDIIINSISFDDTQSLINEVKQKIK